MIDEVCLLESDKEALEEHALAKSLMMNDDIDQMKVSDESQFEAVSKQLLFHLKKNVKPVALRQEVVDYLMNFPSDVSIIIISLQATHVI